MIKSAEDLLPLFGPGSAVAQIEHIKAGHVMFISDIRPDRTTSGRTTKKALRIRENGKDTIRTNNDMLIFNVTAIVHRSGRRFAVQG